MNVLRCKNGHFFDVDAYPNCPHCGAAPAFAGPAAPVKEEKKGGWGKKRKEKKKEEPYNGTPISFGNPVNLGNENTLTEVPANPAPAMDAPAAQKKDKTLDFWQTSSHSGSEPEKQAQPPVQTPAVNSVYHWNPATMSVDSITRFLLRFELNPGKTPIIMVTFDGQKLVVKNTINGRSGGVVDLPQEYFAEREYPLTQDQLQQLYAYLRGAHLENWKTSDTVLGYLNAPPAGFCICNNISITFANGSRFECLEPVGGDFGVLTQQLRRFWEVRHEPAPAPVPVAPEAEVTLTGPVSVEETKTEPAVLVIEETEPVHTVAPEPEPVPVPVPEPVAPVQEPPVFEPVPVAPVEPEVVPIPAPVVAPEPAPAPVVVPEPAPVSSLQEAVRNASASNEGKTLSYFSAATKPSVPQSAPRKAVDPVVGWLACIGGCHFGECFSIHAGRNSIGRSEENRIVISDDNSISRTKHAFVVYEPKKREFFLLPGDSDSLAYVNGDCVFQPQKLNAKDTIDLGDSKFLFVPLCTDAFSWEDYMSKGE